MIGEPRMGRGDEQTTAFLQQRLRALFRTFVVLSWLGVAAHFLVMNLAPASRSVHPWFILGSFLAGCAATTGGALFLRRPRSLASLHFVDATLALFVSAAMTTMILVPIGRIDETYLALITHGFVSVGRALFVPTSPRRTSLLALACAVPVFGAVIVVATVFTERLSLPPAAFIMNNFFCVAVPVALAGVGARVITGLRAELREARQLGQYTLGEKIGEGGMGVVYKAHHALLRRPTAIKLLPTASTEAIQRFEQEVQLTAQLTGPHVVAVFDYGRGEDGTFYYAMEYLDGLDLESLVADYGPQPSARVARILSQVCEALDEAHQRGLIHRDVKPANILLCERGTRSDVAKVVDFGLVKDIERDRTATGIVAGTPAYLAPEAIRDPDTIGPASDIYAVGAVAYFLLTGATVFEGDSIAAIFEQCLSREPPAPSNRAPLPITPAFDALILRCLAREPSARPASAAELGSLLSMADVGEPWSAAQSADWWRVFRQRKAEKQQATETLVTAPTLPMTLMRTTIQAPPSAASVRGNSTRR